MTEEKQLIGFSFSAEGSEKFTSYNPSSGTDNPFSFYKATAAEADRAAEKAASAFPLYYRKTGKEKALFLEAIATGLIEAGGALIETCHQETALPPERILGERGRTVNQLKMFAELLREGSWVDARIETGIPDRPPVPKPDLRFMQIAIGPVVVFGASNFPLAFSVAGGDTASALAAGCPVIVKAHSAHPATSAIVGKAIQKAAKETGMPDGVFSLLYGDGQTTGIQLVKHPAIKAVGFTGSYKAGKALFDAAVARPAPIPVYAEMGSTNPVFVLPAAMKEHGRKIAAGYAASVTLGVGQFCTNPGMLFYQKDDQPDFTDWLKESFENTSGAVMLTPGMSAAYADGVEKNLQINGVSILAKGSTPERSGGHIVTPLLSYTDSQTFQNNPELGEEIFGPASMAVATNSKEEMLDIASNLSGHLTATVHGTESELAQYGELISILEQKAGRVVINGFPTGVEVCSAMVHGGPFPATTDSRSTSVGTAAIYRFTRPVSYQQMPQALLPEELRDKNSLKILRLVNGKRTENDID
ncbi:aldehyde dehydrogenase (NADP(+)) [Terrimonas sp. NA20]|uniref:Aldehyde dehydrogenase (NADP(+)) n=1 Tax=Terrimonas ginsenosidimutans TaxID=2908004 RepID=A0ABS9KV65_9BACT|nr:aldehyde dehydrogenase (NADP(+)) [Terrimonas ginsenosidimutans]MCG2616218.1 aldehyde dehydrogenase (NADP(+)) [Terrimonas ginsenosidimutans]